MPVAVSDMSAVRATPKSITRGPSGPSSTLSGLRSRWTTPASWMAVSAVAIAVARRCRSPPVKRRPSATAPRSVGPSTYSLTMYGLGPSRSASSTPAVQKGATRRAAAPRVRTGLAARVGARVAVQHLDRDPSSLGVVGLVDDALTARAQPSGQPVAPQPLRVPVHQSGLHLTLRSTACRTSRRTGWFAGGRTLGTCLVLLT